MSFSRDAYIKSNIPADTGEAIPNKPVNAEYSDIFPPIIKFQQDEFAVSDNEEIFDEIQSDAILNFNSNDDQSEYLSCQNSNTNQNIVKPKIFTINDLQAIYDTNTDPTTISFLIRDILKSEKIVLELECIEYLMAKMFPFLDGSRYFGSDFHVACLQIVISLLEKYPNHDYKFQSYYFRTMQYFLYKLRTPRPDLYIVFREFAYFYANVLPMMIEELFTKLTIEFTLIFCPFHPLFDLAVHLVKNNVVHNFTIVEYLKLILRLDNPLSQRVFILFDYALTSLESHIDIVRFLLYTISTKPLWSKISMEYLFRCNLSTDNASKKYIKIYIRRAFQWIAITSKKQVHFTRRNIIIDLLTKLRSYECYRIIIDKYVSTLVMDNQDFHEITNSFPIVNGSYDQTFIDELEILELSLDYNLLIRKPKKHLTLEQSKNLALKRSFNETNSDYNHKAIDPFFNNRYDSLYHNNIGFSAPVFYIAISILIILVVISLAA